MKYSIGCALSGGFIKGFAHLGVMQALIEFGLSPNIISGTSAGAMIGAFLADGNEPYQVLNFYEGKKFFDFTKFAVSKEGLFDLKDLVEFLSSHLKSKRIEDLQIPLIINATNFDKGCPVHFVKGDLPIRIAASCCMPIIFKPITINGVHYVDGGVFSNLPVSTLRNICEKVIAVNVSTIQSNTYKANVVSIALRAYDLMFHASSIQDSKNADLLIEPQNLSDYSNTELNKAADIFLDGYNLTKDLLKDLTVCNGNVWVKNDALR